VLATAGNSEAMAATVGGIAPQGELVTIGVTPEPLPISPLQLITPGVSIVGHPSGTAKDIEDTMHFAVLSGVRAWIEELPLSKAAEGYAALEHGRAHYRTVLTM
jgi:D-arabinose 1-dehydrogenase-like Zn-dependent alcohol dehydrogenase